MINLPLILPFVAFVNLIADLRFVDAFLAQVTVKLVRSNAVIATDLRAKETHIIISHI